MNQRTFIYSAVGMVIAVILILTLVRLATGEVKPPVDPYQLTDLESERVQNASLKLALLQARTETLQNELALVNVQRQQVQADLNGLISQIKKDHNWGPETKYDYQTMKFEYDKDAADKTEREKQSVHK